MLEPRGGPGASVVTTWVVACGVVDTIILPGKLTIGPKIFKKIQNFRKNSIFNLNLILVKYMVFITCLLLLSLLLTNLDLNHISRLVKVRGPIARGEVDLRGHCNWLPNSLVDILTTRGNHAPLYSLGRGYPHLHSHTTHGLVWCLQYMNYL